jgi:hypothetical protein
MYNSRFLCEGWLGENGSYTWQDCYSIKHKKITFSEEPWNEIFTIN